jgi:basic amino acid/polyamine antiporter, APA family
MESRLTRPLAHDGPVQQLPRVLNLRQAVALGIGGTVGGGVYVLVGQAAGAAGPAALVSFPLAFAGCLAIALPYAELACRFPRAGGGYAFVRAVLGERAAFGMGWGYWGAYVFVSGFVTLGFGGYLEQATGLPRAIGALGVIAACLALNLRGLRASGRAQALVVLVAVGGLVAFAAWGFPRVDTGRLHPFAPHGLAGIAAGALLAFLASGGFDMVAAAGEEVEDPRRTLPRAILATLAVVLVLYLSVTAVAVGTAPTHLLATSPAPLADAAAGFGGAGAHALVIATALLTTAATANAVLIVTSRISFAMARDGLLPGAVARTDALMGTPSTALAINAALLGAVALTGSIRIAAAVGGFLYVAHFLPPLVVLAVVRRRGGVAPAFAVPLPRVVLPVAFAACLTLVAASGATGALGGAGWLALGAALFLTSRRKDVLRA